MQFPAVGSSCNNADLKWYEYAASTAGRGWNLENGCSSTGLSTAQSCDLDHKLSVCVATQSLPENRRSGTELCQPQCRRVFLGPLFRHQCRGGDRRKACVHGVVDKCGAFTATRSTIYKVPCKLPMQTSPAHSRTTNELITPLMVRLRKNKIQVVDVNDFYRGSSTRGGGAWIMDFCEKCAIGSFGCQGK